jgi:HD-GYP domain-containing protein (c-di-GMP phosphodiesterase class II)
MVFSCVNDRNWTVSFVSAGSLELTGLKCEEIVSWATTIAVADGVEAMASHRPYRQNLGLDAALEEITSGRGILYDPEVVGACLRLFNEKQYRLPEP